jgi:hypothetical protein
VLCPHAGVTYFYGTVPTYRTFLNGQHQCLRFDVKMATLKIIQKCKNFRKYGIQNRAASRLFNFSAGNYWYQGNRN